MKIIFPINPDSLKKNMAITTWLQSHEYLEFSKVEDKELNELFQEVRNEYPHFYIQQHVWYRWRKFLGIIPVEQTKLVSYTLYIDHGHEAQVMNFAADHSWSINTGVTRATIMNFFFGFLAGLKHPQE